MKRKVLLPLIGLALFAASCRNNSEQSVTGVTLNESTYELIQGKDFTLIATIEPPNASNQYLIWESSNPQKADVDGGKVTGKGIGTAMIIVTTADGGFTAKCVVTVVSSDKPPVYPVTGVTLNKTSHKMFQGNEFTLIATVAPSYATNQNVIWGSDKPLVADVTGGKVTAKGVGTAVITVTTVDGEYTETCAITVEAKPYASVFVNTDTKIAEISPLFWGNNLLFCRENKAAMADGKIMAILKQIPATVLRYPGGTIGDNFHWETNLLNNHFMYPYDEGPEQTTFDEFMAYCTELGAEPTLVVNTESWVRKKDMAGGAQEAVKWVQYCKDKGYKIKLWEIGNETYWQPIMTAKEYGAVVNYYAAEMKKADPTILVSANGHWDVNFVGTKERIDPKYWEELRLQCLAINSREDDDAYSARYDALTKLPNTSGTDKWWNDLLDVCGHSIDWMTVHWYFTNNQNLIDGKLNELRAFAKKKTGKDFPIFMSEYNCNNDTPKDCAWRFAQGVCRFLNAGVEMATHWALRFTGGHGPRAFLDYNNKTLQYTGKTIKMFSDNFKGDVVKCDYPSDIFVFATYNPSQVTIVVTPMQATFTAREIDIYLGCISEKSKIKISSNRGADTWQITKELISVQKDFTYQNGIIRFVQDPEAFTFITIEL